jgi:hypothetical protein
MASSLTGARGRRRAHHAGHSRKRLGQYRVRWRGCELRIGGPGDVGLPHTYQKGCRSLSRRTGCEPRVLEGLNGGSSKATCTAPNGAATSDQIALTDGL